MVERYLNDEWKDWLENNDKILETQYRFSTYYYSYQYDNVINWGIRNKRLSEVGYIISKRLIELISKSIPTPKSLTLYRGIKKTDVYDPTSLSIGDIMNEPGFMSTSLSLRKSNMFSGKECCIMIINYPPSTYMLYLKKNFTNLEDEEFEMLTYPGQQLKLVNISHTKSGKKILYFDFIGYMYNSFSELDTLIDTSIDDEFQEFSIEILNLLLNYEFVSITRKHGDPLVFTLLEKTKLDSYEYIEILSLLYHYSFSYLYSVFASNNIQFIYTVNKLPPTNIIKDKGITYSFDENGIIITTETGKDGETSLEDFYKRLLSGKIINQSLRDYIIIKKIETDFSIKGNPIRTNHPNILLDEIRWNQLSLREKYKYIDIQYIDYAIDQSLGLSEFKDYILSEVGYIYY